MHRFGCLADATEHAPEHQFVEGHDRIPVEQSDKPMRAVAGGHQEPGEWLLRLALQWLNGKVELRLTRQFHFGPQGKRAVPFNADHPPEVEGFTKFNGLGMPPATP